MIKIEKVTDEDRRCQSCGKSAKYVLKIQQITCGAIDTIPLCYRCVEHVLDTLQKARKE